MPVSRLPETRGTVADPMVGRLAGGKISRYSLFGKRAAGTEKGTVVLDVPLRALCDCPAKRVLGFAMVQQLDDDGMGTDVARGRDLQAERDFCLKGVSAGCCDAGQ